jgi:hypothetical protein
MAPSSSGSVGLAPVGSLWSPLGRGPARQHTLAHHRGIASTTLYEEVTYIHASQGFPNWDFPFAHTMIANWLCSPCGWSYTGIPDSIYTDFNSGNPPTNPHGYFVDYSEAPWEVVIANEVDMFQFTYDTFTMAPGGSWSANGKDASIGVHGSYGTIHTWRDWCLNNSCDISSSYTCTWPSGWTGSCTLNPSSVPISWAYTATSPSNAASGWYYTGLSATVTVTSNGVNYYEYTSWIWYTDVT